MALESLLPQPYQGWVFVSGDRAVPSHVRGGFQNALIEEEIALGG